MGIDWGVIWTTSRIAKLGARSCREVARESRSDITSVASYALFWLIVCCIVTTIDLMVESEELWRRRLWGEENEMCSIAG